MREMPIVLIALGFVFMLVGGLIALWASFQMSSLEVAHDIFDEWGYPYDVYPDLIDEEYERLRDYYSAVRVAGVTGMIVGIIVAFYGFILLRKEPEPIAPASSSLSTVSGVVNFCEYCGRQIPPGAVRCPGCGRAFQQKVRGVSSEQEVR